MGNCLSNQTQSESPFDNDTGKISLDSIPRKEGDILQSTNLKSFTFSDLKAATRNFHPPNIIGDEGSGFIFKGWVDENSLAASTPANGMVVAVKKLNERGGLRHEEWLAEIKFLGELRHPNIVKLIGYCVEDDHRLLVYEFMSKASMEHHLFRRGSNLQPLSWGLRMKIALGSARGLAYLHGAETEIIYHDFRTSNILLDSSYNGKLSHEGFSRDELDDDMDHVSTWGHVSTTGTYGYSAPEYLAAGHLSTKSDVYSFGVVLVEILTGRKAIDKNRPAGEYDLVDWAKPYLTNKGKISRILDPRIKDQFSLKRALKVASLAFQCLNRNPKLRPTMDEVVTVLEQLQDSDETIDNDIKRKAAL